MNESTFPNIRLLQWFVHYSLHGCNNQNSLQISNFEWDYLPCTIKVIHYIVAQFFDDLYFESQNWILVS